MKSSLLSLAAISVLGTLLSAQVALGQDYSVVERGQDFAVYRKTVALTNDTGSVSIQTNEFTVLDHGMNYLQNGEWHESRDLVESFPDGAIARSSN